jgi:hypothetical protein
MPKNIRLTFLLIALTQALHSIEEYLGKLWDVYQPATFICGLVSSNLKTGFIIINVGLFIVLMVIWLLSKSTSLKGLMWFWAIMEIINGFGHSGWAIMERSYEPGLITAPILIFLALRLSRQLIRQQKS